MRWWSYLLLAGRFRRVLQPVLVELELQLEVALGRRLDTQQASDVAAALKRELLRWHGR